MCRWPVLHVALWIIIVCIGLLLRMFLLHLRCYLYKIHIHSHFSYALVCFLECFCFISDVTFTNPHTTPTFLLDYIRYRGLFGLPLLQYIYIYIYIYNIYIYIYIYIYIILDNFDVIWKNFVILGVSGWNIIGKYYLNACLISAFSFLIWVARR